MNSNLKAIIIQCSAFTIAHSISLGLSAANLVVVDAKIIEPLIAITILVTALENIIQDKINKWRVVFILLFGIIHGLGFANALREIGLDKRNFFLSLLSFNVGVECGQIFIILIAYFLIGKWFREEKWYKKRIVYPISSVIGSIAMYWTIERMFS